MAQAASPRRPGPDFQLEVLPATRAAAHDTLRLVRRTVTRTGCGGPVTAACRESDSESAQPEGGLAATMICHRDGPGLSESAGPIRLGATRPANPGGTEPY